MFKINTLHHIPQIFDRPLGRQRRLRCDTADIINHPMHVDLQHILLERLQFMTGSFETILVLGDFPVKSLEASFPNSNIYALNTTALSNLQGDIEFLPFKNNCADLVISYFDLHTVNDIPGALLQIKNILKQDGLFLGVMLGGDSLWQLKQTCHHAEEKVRGGVSPRVAPMISLHDAAALMQRAGFSLPVVDHEPITRLYEHPLAILRDLKSLGLSNILRDRDKRMMNLELLNEISIFYQQEFEGTKGEIPCFFDVIFLSGWGPAPQQQRPLMPGSAQIHFSQVM